MLRKFPIKFRVLIVSLFALIFISRTAYAQLEPSYFGKTIEAIYRNLGGTLPPGLDLAVGLNLLFYLALPFALIVVILYDAFTAFKLFKNRWVRGFVAIVISVMLIPARAFNIIVLWLYTAGGVGVILLFFALFMLSINRYASERIHELGYTGVFSKPGFLYGTAALAWGTIFGIVGYYVFGLGGAFMAFLVGAIIGMILVFIEVRRAKVAPKVAEIEKKLFEKLEDIRKQIGILAKERESLQAQLQKMLEEGRAAGDPEVIAIQRQIDAVDEQIRSLRLQMEKEREIAETEEMRRRVSVV